tara:strand:- start:58 stop:405 length:348 start_codon:yes stop_codon:yes gene_type:complete
MKRFIFLSMFLLLIPFYAFSQEDKKELQVTQFNVVTPVFCGATEKFNEVFPKENLKFTGFIDDSHIVKLFVGEDNSYSVIIENSGGLSCIQNSGGPGILMDNNKNIKYFKEAGVK